MSDAKSTPLFGRLAVHLKMIDMDQLAQATSQQGRPGESRQLGEILLEMGFINARQHAQLVTAQQQVLARQRSKRAPAASAGAAPSPSAGTASPAAGVPTAPRAPEPASVVTPPGAVTPPSTGTTSGPPAARAASAARPAAQTDDAPAPSDPADPSLRVLADAPPLATPSQEDRAAFEALLQQAVERGASDLHIHAGARVRLRSAGGMQEIGEPLGAELAERLVLCALSPEDRQLLAAHGELDLCTSMPGLGRFRTNVYRQQRGFDGVFRHISPEPPTFEQLGLPASMARFTNYHQGMVLVTGPTGCGKSATLAALVNLINEERREHILTIEDPIEYIHPSKRCLVNQRSVNRHTKSFARALRAALREDPDVIVIGELRDLETISLALTAAETGHFVLATLHTNSTIRTLNRMVGAYPAEQQNQIRTMLSESLRAVLSQRLVPRADGAGRVPALETLVVTKAVGNLIRENKTYQIHSILQTGASQGMGLLDHSLRDHVRDGVVSREEALRHVEDPKVLAA